MPDAPNLTEMPIGEVINLLSVEYDNRTLERHEMGAEKYGDMTWLGVDTVEAALLEVLDLGNYARYSYIKLRLLQLQLAKFQADGIANVPKPGKEMLGKEGIITGKGVPDDV